MGDMNKLLPRDKFDFERVNRLIDLERTELITLLPSLIEWVQDMNWPISKEIVKILLYFPEEITPLIKKVLNGDDHIWKFWSLSYLVMNLPLEWKILFKDDLAKFSNSPTEIEKLEGLDEIAQEILLTL